MHLIHHVKPHILSSVSRRLPASITPHSLSINFRTYSSDTTLPDTPTITEEFIATEDVKPEPSSGPPPETSSKKKKPTKSYLSDKLRSRSSESSDKKKPPKRKVVSAAENAISRNHSTQNDMIRTLHQAIFAESTEKRGKKKKAMKKKPQRVDASPFFQLVQGSSDVSSPPIREGWKGEEWNESWGKDGK